MKRNSEPISPLRLPTVEDATGFDPLLFGWALSEELVQWFRSPEFDAVRERVVRAAAAHCHRVWRRSQREQYEPQRSGRFTRRWLNTFFRHWLSAKLHAVAPRLAERLPHGYALGHSIQLDALRSYQP